MKNTENANTEKRRIGRPPMSEQAAEYTIHVRVDPDTKSRLKLLSEMDQMSLSQVTRRALMIYMIYRNVKDAPIPREEADS